MILEKVVNCAFYVCFVGYVFFSSSELSSNVCKRINEREVQTSERIVSQEQLERVVEEEQRNLGIDTIPVKALLVPLHLYRLGRAFDEGIKTIEVTVLGNRYVVRHELCHIKNNDPNIMWLPLYDLFYEPRAIF